MSDFLDYNLYDDVPDHWASITGGAALHRLLTESTQRIALGARRTHQGVEVPVTFSGIY